MDVAVGRRGWTIADVVLHLAQSEESVVRTVSGGEPRAGGAIRWRNGG